MATVALPRYLPKSLSLMWGDDGGGEQPEIDEASEHMGSGRRISVGGADKIEDDDRKPGPATLSAHVGAVGEARSRG